MPYEGLGYGRRRVDPLTGLPSFSVGGEPEPAGAADPPMPDAPQGPAPAGAGPPMPVARRLSPPDATRGEAGVPSGSVDPAEQAMMEMIRRAPDVGAPRGKPAGLSVPPVNPEQMGTNLQSFIKAAGGPWPDRQRPSESSSSSEPVIWLQPNSLVDQVLNNTGLYRPVSLGNASSSYARGEERPPADQLSMAQALEGYTTGQKTQAELGLRAAMHQADIASREKIAGADQALKEKIYNESKGPAGLAQKALVDVSVKGGSAAEMEEAVRKIGLVAPKGLGEPPTAPGRLIGVEGAGGGGARPVGVGPRPGPEVVARTGGEGATALQRLEALGHGGIQAAPHLTKNKEGKLPHPDVGAALVALENDMPPGWVEQNMGAILPALESAYGRGGVKDFMHSNLAGKGAAFLAKDPSIPFWENWRSTWLPGQPTAEDRARQRLRARLQLMGRYPYQE